MGERSEETRVRVVVPDERVRVVDAKADAAGVVAEAAKKCGHGNHGYGSVLGYCERDGREVSTAEASAHGDCLTRICSQQGVRVQANHDGRFGSVNTYPESVLDEYFARVRANEGA